MSKAIFIKINKIKNLSISQTFHSCQHRKGLGLKTGLGFRYPSPLRSDHFSLICSYMRGPTGIAMPKCLYASVPFISRKNGFQLFTI